MKLFAHHDDGATPKYGIQWYRFHYLENDPLYLKDPRKDEIAYTVLIYMGPFMARLCYAPGVWRKI